MSTIQAGRQATVSVDVGAGDLRFETGKLAKQADGAVVVRSGETMVLADASDGDRTIAVAVDVHGSAHWTLSVEVPR